MKSQGTIQCSPVVQKALRAATDPIFEDFFGRIRWLAVYGARAKEVPMREVGRFPFVLAEWYGGREYEAQEQNWSAGGTVIAFEGKVGGERLFYFTGPGFQAFERIVVKGGCKPLMRLAL